MTATFILISRFPLAPHRAGSLAAHVRDDARTRYLVSLDELELLQLRGYETLDAFARAGDTLRDDRERLTTQMTGDVRRELLAFVEAPKPINCMLAPDDYIQLRHVEVPPQRHIAYRAWREQTIFQVVRESPQIHTFLAYHSLISGQPGVMFLSGFNCNPQEYLTVFSSERYREIVRQAGDNYIAGGSAGLYTQIYCHPRLLAS